jgi:hypothetical protein
VASRLVPPPVGTPRVVPPGIDLVRGPARRRPVRTVVVTGLARGGLVRTLRFDAP